MDNQVLGYKDLAAIPKDKAILDIERPDLMIYEPHFTYSLLEHVELPRSREVRGGRLLLDETWGKGSPSHTGEEAESLSCFLFWWPDSKTRKATVGRDQPMVRPVSVESRQRPAGGWGVAPCTEGGRPCLNGSITEQGLGAVEEKRGSGQKEQIGQKPSGTLDWEAGSPQFPLL